jgi:hypothetical protein
MTTRWALVSAAALLAGCGGGGGGGGGDGPANSAPQAQAGPDQAVDEQTQVTLDGSASSDGDGQIASHQWSQTAGAPVTLANPASAVTTFTAPALSTPTTLTFQLRVVDNGNAADVDSVDVNVNPIPGLNFAPQADAGIDHFAGAGSPAVLDGSASVDSDGSIAQYSWEQLSGPDVAIADPMQATTSFPAPEVAEPTEFGFRLTVTDDEGLSASSEVTVTVVPAIDITLSGRITFDLVPASGSGPAFLNYGATQAAPARAVTVEVIDATDGVTVVASGRSDAGGDYSFTVPGFIEVFVRARAEMIQAGTPGWEFRVLDNTEGDALYVVSGQAFNTGPGDLVRDLHAASGWNGVSYAEPRAAAPLAILDVIHDAVDVLLTADPDLVFPPLDMHWSVKNVPVFGAGGAPDTDSGEIGTSFFRTGPDGGIFLLGAANQDTEEYDRHVIAHEWGHYLEAEFSRSDSIGGPHTTGDQLDMRVAFGEGWGNAFSAMVTGDSVYRDTMGPQQSFGFAFDVEGESRQNPGWYSEQSIQELIYDFYDDNADVIIGTAVSDNVNLGFAPIFDVLVDEQRLTPAMTSLFPFIEALTANNPASEAAINDLLGVHDIDPVADAYGSTETNAGNPESEDVLPIYTPIAVNGGSVNVCSTDEFSGSQTGSVNKLGSRRYLRFQATVSGTHTITATTTAADGESTDPDIWLHHGNLHAASLSEPTEACAAGNLAECKESLSVPLVGGEDYVLEVYEWTNTNASDDPDFPPIGRACFDMEISQ